MASFGGSVKLTGESEYRKALKEITSSLKLVSSELKLTNTEFANGDKSLKQTKSSYKDMCSALDEQKNKIKNAREELAKMEKQYGSNNPKVQEFKTRLNDAEVKLKEMESATDKSTKELKEMKEGFDDAGKGAISFGDILKANILGDMVVGGIKALGSAIAGVGKAFISLGKDALDSYARYEQLVGGVDTLFKDSSAKVQDYANKAFKTAGLSANDYMETITGFSASLIQGLNGDTTKATEIGNRAIIDMSDNANKMGTDMSLIQNAYQGFAKQNYTMLDNLKLGYGGTKTEMQRLIKDASKMKDVQKELGITVDASSMSFDNIINAISVMQSHLDIAGTTSEEASTTIEGSVNSMKSAWQNLITGIANDNIEFDALVNDFVESIVTVGENILPRVEIIVDGIVQLIFELGNRIIEALPDLTPKAIEMMGGFIDGMIENVDSIITTVLEVGNQLLNAFIGLLPDIIRVGLQVIVSLAFGIADALPTLIPTIIDTVLTIVEGLIDNIDLIIDAGIQLIIGLTEGLVKALPKIVEKAPVIIEKIIWALANNMPKIIEAGINIVVQLAGGIIKAIPQLLKSIPRLISTYISAFASYYSKLGEIGSNMIKGIWQGLSNAKDWLLGKVKNLMGSITDSIKSFFGIHSPSTLFRDEIGENLALGLGEGFTDTMQDVTDDMQSSIPTSFDVDANMNGSSAISSNNSLIEAFKTALSEMKIELDDEVAGRFVDKTVTKLIYA